MFVRIFKIITVLALLIGAVAISYIYLGEVRGLWQGGDVAKISPAVSKATAPSIKIPVKEAAQNGVPTTTNIKPAPTTIVVKPKEVIAPGPLRAPSLTTASPSSLPPRDLSVRGVIKYTNIARASNGGFSTLEENETLNLVAQMKVDDMFAKQYFEHVSPAGVGASDLAKTAGYEYVIVGENLALGDFGSDSKLVDAWMASPGHRANILNKNYQEIGVAVGKGMYEGRETWLAVQSFGMPLSACPAISTSMKAEIESNNTEIERMRAELDAKKAQIDSAPKKDPNYNTYVEEFNALVPQYNTQIKANRILVENYNAQVLAYNNCVNAIVTN